jgi:hypothetical protein
MEAKYLVLIDGDDNDTPLNVPLDLFPKLVNELNGAKVVMCEAKAFMHAVKNLKLEIDFFIYDVGIGGFIYSYGRSKGDIEGVLTYYEIIDRVDRAGIVRGIKKVYEEQQELQVARSD